MGYICGSSLGYRLSIWGDCSHGPLVPEELGNKARERSSTVDDMKHLQEPVALTEHREKKWESTAARLISAPRCGDG